MAHHDDVRADRLQGPDRVDEGLALLDGAPGSGEIHNIGAKSLGGDFEARARAGALLVEEGGNGGAAQCGDLADGAGPDFAHGLSGLHDRLDVRGGKGVRVEEVLRFPALRGGGARCSVCGGLLLDLKHGLPPLP